MLSEAEKTAARNYHMSQNFTLYELINSSSYPELVVYPDDDILDMLEDMAQNTLQKIRDKFGSIKVNSGYRNQNLNRAVGGVRNSVHQYILKGEKLGKACDITPDLNTYTLEEVFHWIIDNHEALGLKTAIIYRKPNIGGRNFIHMDTRDKRENFVALEKVARGKYELYERN